MDRQCRKELRGENSVEWRKKIVLYTVVRRKCTSRKNEEVSVVWQSSQCLKTHISHEKLALVCFPYEGGEKDEGSMRGGGGKERGKVRRKGGLKAVRIK